MRDFRRFIARLGVLLLLLFAGDRGLGLLLDSLRDRTTYPPYAKVRHVLTAARGELLCLGNSRSDNHYVAPILQDSLGLPTYTAGISGGEAFVEAYWMLSMALDRGQVPAGVIVDVSEPDLNIDGEHLARMSLDRFAPWYGTGPAGDSLFVRAGIARLFAFSRTLRHYYEGLSPLQGVLYGRGGDAGPDLRGYSPLGRPSDPAAVRTEVEDRPLGELQRWALEGMMAACARRQIPLVLVVSPSLMAYPRGFTELAGMVAAGVWLINYQDSGLLMRDTALYYNENHLWDSGARVFSRRLAYDIKRLGVLE